MEELKQLAEKEINKIETILKDLKVVDNSALELYNLILSYFTDAKHFFDKKDFIRAFEAAVICWAYCDAGLHLKVFQIDEKYKKMFTVD
jgi:hypothetical protein